MKKNLNKIFLILIFLLALGLRLYQLGENPPSPYWEEAALGYDAYSILKTGKDFHGNSWPLVAFESFGDYKPSLYFYTLVPSIAAFGLNSFAVRFPSALFGSLTVLLIYLLVKKLNSNSGALALLSALLLAISPWHLQLSRVGFEANLGLFLVTLGAWLFWLFPAVIAWALSLYTYHANRVFTPLLGLAFGLWYLKPILKQKLKVLLTVFLFLLISWPLFTRLNTPEVKQRFLETSAFSTLNPILKSNQLISQDGGGVVPKLIHHRYFQYTKIFLSNYFSHFSFNYLFVSGDANPRHSTQAVGSLYLLQLPLLLIGIFFFFYKRQWSLTPIFIWLILAPIPASLTLASPHALRSLALVIPLTIFSAFGLLQLIKFKPVLWLALLVLLLEFTRHQFIYYYNYPKLYSSHWQFGYQEVVEYINQNQDKYQQIYFTREQGRPSIYYWFYSQTDPTLVQKQESLVPHDQGEFLQFNNIYFGDPASIDIYSKTLIISGPNSDPKGKLIKTIYNLGGEGAFKLYEN